MTKRKDPRIPHGLITHGKSRTAEHYTWLSAKGRCYNPRDRGFKNYGGRGIYMCDRWKNSFENFLADMGPRPEGYSIERIDYNGPYSPENCKWIPRKEQNKNKRNVTYLTFQGKAQSISDWSREFGWSVGVIWRRLYYRGWTVEKSLSTPLDESKRAHKRGSPSIYSR